MNDGKLPPPFVVGQKGVFDRNGEYIVTAMEEARVMIERSDGRAVRCSSTGVRLRR